LNAGGDDETSMLDIVDLWIERGKCPAQELLDLYHGAWNGNIARVYEHCAI